MNSSLDVLLPTVWFDGDTDGRVMVADSLSFFEHEPWLNDVAVGASFAGAPTAAMALRGGVKAWVAHEGGPGKDDAGVSGLVLSQRLGIPAAAIATNTARLSGGMSLITGTVSRANEAALRLGVRAGQTGGEAAKLMLKAPRARSFNLDGIIDESIHEVVSTREGKIYAVWSSSRVKGEHPNDVFCLASHGGKVMAQYALAIKPRGVIANDAGGGLDNSGMDGLDVFERVSRTPAATVSTNSARIGDALSTYHDGIISAANQSASALGIKVGMPARRAAELMLSAKR
ncbi:MAG: hypothetical protein A3G81_06430 [Betaproteobacteria bacterium RIFCSPLOWO2_12_FULL_65_14]|nr:MAG: hypothetical protein A3G81_06430 [Betaproteobacteria bacterium RIFCSPLOWO2_12_FULL_65_14]